MVPMKRIYLTTSNFLSKYKKTNYAIFITIILLIVIMLITFEQNVIIAICLGTFLYSFYRFFTYNVGEIPFAADSLYIVLKVKYGKEKAEEVYKKVSLRISAISYIISWILLLIGILFEILILVFD